MSPQKNFEPIRHEFDSRVPISPVIFIDNPKAFDRQFTADLDPYRPLSRQILRPAADRQVSHSMRATGR